MRRLILCCICLLTTAFAVWLAGDAAHRAQVLDLLQAGGVLGFYLFTVVYNVLVIPFPYDPFLAATPWLYPGQGAPILGAAIGATCTAALIAYGLGQTLTTHAQRWFKGHKHYPWVMAKLQQYGWGAVALSAITPLPFSLVCWVCGMARTPFIPFILTVLLTRGLRYFVVWRLVWGV